MEEFLLDPKTIKVFENELCNSFINYDERRNYNNISGVEKLYNSIIYIYAFYFE